MYKGIIFDLDNTLLNYSLSELGAMQRTIAEHQILEKHSLDWDAFWKTYSNHNFRYWMDFVNGKGPNRSIEEVLVSSFRDSLNLNHEVHAKLMQTYWDYFCSTCIFEDGAQQVLEEARSSFKLGIISNGIGLAQRKRLATGNIYDTFSSIVVSDEVGVRKPKKEIFDISLKELGLRNHEVLFIGDSLSDDYQGALNAGLDFCYYNRSKKELPDDVVPLHTINDLQELLKVI